MMNIKSLAIEFTDGKLRILNQQLLPHVESWIEVKTVDQMIEAIKSLKVRGAPLIGVAAAFALAQSALQKKSKEELLKKAQALYEARPTAVNLMICMDRMKKVLHENFSIENVVKTAENIFTEDFTLCERIATHGAQFIQDGDNILTHCNTGGLATAGVGTALGIIRKAHEQGKKIHVYVDETRPLLQGGRLTTWELKKLNIPFTLITDNMAGHVMSLGKVQKIFVGSDRIALNGDFANKIGTYSVAVLARHHNVPFYVAAPYTTVDVECPNGKAIPIEQRKAEEVLGVSGSFGDSPSTIEWAPEGTPAYNPAFDVTPAHLTTAWILDNGVFTQKDIESGALKKRN
ncbi:S-methyl-5-thioribose-1-phosphate isomerase [Bdellovibrio sp. HCB337]|uniref:S-methyl-5-thioribose-1-phosphate isomerase n=1 Tax=Bdellovibrio sp. HCB337 TaxID=3394358 RepID=UPI0039A68EA1